MAAHPRFQVPFRVKPRYGPAFQVSRHREVVLTAACNRAKGRGRTVYGAAIRPVHIVKFHLGKAARRGRNRVGVPVGIRANQRIIPHVGEQVERLWVGRWPGHENRREPKTLCPVHRALCDERAGGIVVPHSKRKERVLNGAQSIEGEPKVKRHDRATCPVDVTMLSFVLLETRATKLTPELNRNKPCDHSHKCHTNAKAERVTEGRQDPPPSPIVHYDHSCTP